MKESSKLMLRGSEYILTDLALYFSFSVTNAYVGSNINSFRLSTFDRKIDCCGIRYFSVSNCFTLSNFAKNKLSDINFWMIKIFDKNKNVYISITDLKYLSCHFNLKLNFRKGFRILSNHQLMWINFSLSRQNSKRSSKSLILV